LDLELSPIPLYIKFTRQVFGNGFAPLSEGEGSEALLRVAFDSLGQKQCVLEPYSLSLIKGNERDKKKNEEGEKFKI